MISKTTLKTVVLSFWKGATEPSMGTIMGILGLVIFQIVALCWYWTPQRLSQINLSWIPNSNNALYVYASLTANRFKYLPSTENRVVMVSTSSGRNSIHNFDQVSEQLSSLTGLPTKFYMLSTAEQTLWESGVILDSIPAEFCGVVILSVGLARLSWGIDTLEKQQKTLPLALNSTFLFNEAKLAGIAVREPLGIFLIDHRDLFYKFAIVGAKVLIRGQSKNLHYTSTHDLNSEKYWKIYRNRLNKDKKLFAENSAYNLGILSRIIRQLQDKNIPVVLLESTLHPRAYQIMGVQYLQYRHTIEEFAHRQGVHYWNLNDEAELSASDFMDYSHMSTSGARKRYQQVLVQHLVELMQTKHSTQDLK